MGKLTTHVLDTYHGQPARGMALVLYYVGEGGDRTPAWETTTNQDGRTDVPLLEGDELRAGDFELVFDVRAYFQRMGHECPFLSKVAVRFTVFDAAQAYHVPLLVSPWSYSTYRGS
ncbi:hydroxyisourate hydrolase [Aggregatilineales bacterium SYSU G02658]